MLEVDYQWTSTGSSGGLTALYIASPPMESVMYASHSTLASTQSVSVQTAPSSAGPWFNDVQQSFSTVGSTQYALRLTGPYKWVRPYLHSASTGTYTFRLVGVS
jgi:hypothetical protein